MRLDLAAHEVTRHDAARTPLDDDEVEHLVARVHLHAAACHFLLLIGAEQELLARLAPRVERARHLGAAEGPVREQPAVFAGKRHALRDALVDDVHGDLREAVHVRLASAEIAALDRVVEQAMDRIAVVPVVLRRVDAALGRDRVRAPGRILEAEAGDVVPELAHAGRGAGAGEARTHDDHVEFPLVRGIHELHLEAVRVPLVGQRAAGNPGVEFHGAPLT
jgi:hypothetical protein